VKNIPSRAATLNSHLLAAKSLEITLTKMLLAVESRPIGVTLSRMDVNLQYEEEP
jgi:hypothetical protein